jgi:hypothetical protein
MWNIKHGISRRKSSCLGGGKDFLNITQKALIATKVKINWISLKRGFFSHQRYH